MLRPASSLLILARSLHQLCSTSTSTSTFDVTAVDARPTASFGAKRFGGACIRAKHWHTEISSTQTPGIDYTINMNTNTVNVIISRTCSPRNIWAC